MEHTQTALIVIDMQADYTGEKAHTTTTPMNLLIKSMKE